MYQTISNISEPIILQDYIDNKDNSKKIGLKSFSYTLGWYNLDDADVQIVGELLYKIPDGYYNFNQLLEYLEGVGITIDVNDTNGIAIVNSSKDIKISGQLKNILGLPKRRLNAGKVYEGDKPIDLATYKNIYVHLEQLNISDNFLDGKRSTVLAIVPVENKKFGDITTVRFEHPEYKSLSGGTIYELKLSIRDENNKEINNNKLPISCVLEIIEDKTL